MPKERQSSVGYVIVTLTLLAAVMAAVQWLGDADVKFSRTVLTRLVRGKPAAAKQIDWIRFSALGADIGQQYASLKDKRDQDAFQRMFVLSFAEGFRRSGASLRNYAKWRVQQRQAGKTVVAADIPKYRKTVLFTVVSVAGRRRLAAMQWADDPTGSRQATAQAAPVTAAP